LSLALWGSLARMVDRQYHSHTGTTDAEHP